MNNKKKNDSPFLKKIRFKYRVSFLDENTLEKALSFRISPLFIVLYFSLFLLLSFLLLSTIIFITPLRNYLPGYGKDLNRELIIAEFMGVDSLEHQIKQQANYLASIKDIISGDIAPEEIAPLDSFVIVDQTKDIRLDKSEQERSFVDRFEDEEKYNLSSINSRPQVEYFEAFMAPTKGIIEKHYNEAEGFYGISLKTKARQNVMSVMQGSVVFADFSIENGWVIQVQHSNNYLSIYKNNNQLLKQVGESVSTGENIAITGTKNEEANNFYFELWLQGSPVNPEELIVF